MKMCRNHLTELRVAIELRGMRHLVDTPTDQYNALKDAHDAICGQYTKDVGPQEAFGGPPVCPLCMCRQEDERLDVNWIDGSANDALVTARDLGLLGHAPIN